MHEDTLMILYMPPENEKCLFRFKSKLPILFLRVNIIPHPHHLRLLISTDILEDELKQYLQYNFDVKIVCFGFLF